MSPQTVAIAFGEAAPAFTTTPDLLIAPASLTSSVKGRGVDFSSLEEVTDGGSVYGAGAFLDELAVLELGEKRVSTSVTYEGFELWWLHYDNLFFYFCVPYMRYKRLLASLEGAKEVHLYGCPHVPLFTYYLEAHGVRVITDAKQPALLSLGALVQILLTLLSLPSLVLLRGRVMIFVGDKFAEGEHDFRMPFIYQALRSGRLRFFECVRSIEPWHRVLAHALARSRPVVYYEGVMALGRLASVFGASRVVLPRLPQGADADSAFRFKVATHYLARASADISATKIMRSVWRAAGLKGAFFTAAMDRNYAAVLGCKLAGVPTVGIMHGVATRYGTPYDFTPGYRARSLSVDRYGVWSEWWREYFTERSDAYTREQLYLSGPMHPTNVPVPETERAGPVKVVLVAEQTAEPLEVMPYLQALIKSNEVSLTIKFRAFGDGFEAWLKVHAPEVLADPRITIVKGSMQEAFKNAEVALGCHSTGVLEALVAGKAPIFIRSNKWGDYYDLLKEAKTRPLFAENPVELLERIKGARTLPPELLAELRERYFGDPGTNGSSWVVAQLKEYSQRP